MISFYEVLTIWDIDNFPSLFSYTLPLYALPRLWTKYKRRLTKFLSHASASLAYLIDAPRQSGLRRRDSYGPKLSAGSRSIPDDDASSLFVLVQPWYNSKRTTYASPWSHTRGHPREMLNSTFVGSFFSQVGDELLYSGTREYKMADRAMLPYSSYQRQKNTRESEREKERERRSWKKGRRRIGLENDAFGRRRQRRKKELRGYTKYIYVRIQADSR